MRTSRSGCANGRGFEQHAVDNREDGDVGGQAQGQRGNGRDREAAVLPEHPKGDPQVLKQSFHGYVSLRTDAAAGSRGYDSRVSELEARTLRKVRWRLIPFLFLLYVIAYLDRVNVGFAALDMNRDLGFSAAVYGFGSGIFFLSYTLLEVPSNLMLARVGARRWIARIMITWGLVSMAMMFVDTPLSFYVLRFLLGAAEAGFFPGLILYLTHWFPSRERARAVALFMTATAMAGVIGAPISSAILQLHGVGGLHGWQWLFIIEGMPAVLLAPVVLRRLTERPADATWLAADERDWLTREMAAEHDQTAGMHVTFRGAASQRTAVGTVGALLLHRHRVLRRQLLAAADRAGDGRPWFGHRDPADSDSLRRGHDRPGGDRSALRCPSRAAMARGGTLPDWRRGIRADGAGAADRRGVAR